MMKTFLTALLVLFSFHSFSQDGEIISTRHVPRDLKDHTLLVLDFSPLTEDDVEFKAKGLMDDKQTMEFLYKENQKIQKHNSMLRKNFKGQYAYPYIFVNAEQIDNFRPEKYPYVLERYVVKKVKKDAQKASSSDWFTYIYFFRNRKTNKSYADINFVSHNFGREIKVIIRALNYYLGD